MNAYISGTYASVEYDLYNRFMANGFTLAQTCGILANIYHECRFNPTTVNTNEKAYGLCQWRLDRRSLLHSKYGSSPNVAQQFSYILYELNAGYKTARDLIKAETQDNSATASRVAGHFAKHYERSHSSNHQMRKDTAVDYFNHYSGIAPSSSMRPSSDLLDSTNSSDGIPESNIPAYLSLTAIDPYSEIISSNLSRVTAGGFDYGYLIDMTHNREFKFYIPDFSEAAGAQWGDITIPGRSVSIKSYQSTNSRVITVSLELFAGEGLYKSGEDVVGTLHSDANFVKSLEYPDYNNPIVRPPAVVHLILGAAISMQGVVSEVNVEHRRPLDSQNRAMHLKLSFTVVQTAVNPPQYSDIANGSYAMISTEKVGTVNGGEKPGVNNTYVSLK